MDRFQKSEFLRDDRPARGARCHDLAQLLKERLRGQRDFHHGVQDLVSELRGLGHDLWSFDDSDEVEVWCPNYVTPSGPGIIVTFRPGCVDVEWSDQ